MQEIIDARRNALEYDPTKIAKGIEEGWITEKRYNDYNKREEVLYINTKTGKQQWEPPYRDTSKLDRRTALKKEVETHRMDELKERAEMKRKKEAAARQREEEKQREEKKRIQLEAARQQEYEKRKQQAAAAAARHESKPQSHEI